MSCLPCPVLRSVRNVRDLERFAIGVRVADGLFHFSADTMFLKKPAWSPGSSNEWADPIDYRSGPRHDRRRETGIPMSRNIICIVLAIIAIFLSTQTCSAREPGWSRYVIARGAQRQELQSTRLIHRPYRPFHFYGNTVRRMYHRGTVRPTLQDLQSTATMLTSSQ